VISAKQCCPHILQDPAAAWPFYSS
jgi:hypothetical protein